MIRLALRVRRADAELVLAELLELAPGGVEEREDGDVVEYAVYGAPGELPGLPDLLREYASSRVLLTVDFPFSWPVDFITHLMGETPRSWLSMAEDVQQNWTMKKVEKLGQKLENKRSESELAKVNEFKSMLRRLATAQQQVDRCPR